MFHKHPGCVGVETHARVLCALLQPVVDVLGKSQRHLLEHGRVVRSLGWLRNFSPSVQVVLNDCPLHIREPLDCFGHGVTRGTTGGLTEVRQEGKVVPRCVLLGDVVDLDRVLP